MSTIVKSMVLGLGLAAGLSVGVHAQTVVYPTAPYPSIAALPPDAVTVAPAPPPVVAPVAPSAAVVTPMHGPEPGRGWYPSERQTVRIAPSPEWIGPKAH
jgi:hypothetical protein